jgi:hypothetical protein
MMKEPKDWFIDRIQAGLEKEDAQQIARLISWLDDDKEKINNAQYEAGLNAAMLADICELLFGGNATHAPEFMSYAHAGWACGPMQKPEDSSYVRAMLNHWLKKDLKKEIIKKIEEWEDFLKQLAVRVGK